jgi:MoxR-like ATPase
MEEIQKIQKKISDARLEFNKVIVGQEDVFEKLMTSILSNSHSLLVGYPGLAKTLMVQTLAKILGLDFKRIQFTPDLMPSDIIGTEILESSEDGKRYFKFMKGPIFSNIVLADEINRTPPKTQAALLEAMQERTVTVSGHEYSLDNPFFVLATQNPIEQEGTYPLPEAQLDRFLFFLKLDYPSVKDEIEIVSRTTRSRKEVADVVFSKDELVHFQKKISELDIEKNVIEYAVNLVQATRPENNKKAFSIVKYGAGPRASQNLILAAKAYAVIKGDILASQDHIKAIAKDVLRHRILVSYQGEAEGFTADSFVDNLLK